MADEGEDERLLRLAWGLERFGPIRGYSSGTANADFAWQEVSENLGEDSDVE